MGPADPSMENVNNSFMHAYNDLKIVWHIVWTLFKRAA